MMFCGDLTNFKENEWQLSFPATLPSDAFNFRLSAAYAAAPATDINYERPPIPRWWERGGDLINVKDIGSAQEFLDEMVRL